MEQLGALTYAATLEFGTVTTWRRSMIQTANNLAIGWNYHTFSKLDESQLQFVSPEILSKLSNTIKKSLSQKMLPKLDYYQIRVLSEADLVSDTQPSSSTLEIPFANVNIFGIKESKTDNESSKASTEQVPDQTNILRSRIIYLYSGAKTYNLTLLLVSLEVLIQAFQSY